MRNTKKFFRKGEIYEEKAQSIFEGIIIVVVCYYIVFMCACNYGICS